jgi:hypothetical protein
MNARKAHKIWIQQCEAARTIKSRFGLRLRPYQNCGCTIQERAVAYLLAAHSQVIPLRPPGRGRRATAGTIGLTSLAPSAQSARSASH